MRTRLSRITGIGLWGCAPTVLRLTSPRESFSASGPWPRKDQGRRVRLIGERQSNAHGVECFGVCRSHDDRAGVRGADRASAAGAGDRDGTDPIGSNLNSASTGCSDRAVEGEERHESDGIDGPEGQPTLGMGTAAPGRRRRGQQRALHGGGRAGGSTLQPATRSAPPIGTATNLFIPASMCPTRQTRHGR